MSTEIGPIVKRSQSYRGTGNFQYNNRIIGPTIGIEVDQGIIGMEIITGEAIIPKTIEEIIIDRTMIIKGTGIEIQG